ncbi:2-phospho-L-lactate guanylyltransferase [Egibacter rhizosphaerae]|uniref:Phosphoenolpyruvate guanylyltransferase n=1 Tax=Egibacter rhizosphaerae TaxID=1670831 RepID=A0A411YCT2_9ACTN|nr:2-phospho-L-lactate guanylyltransferase [Egibacter rhizosphaerae]QBI18998.1 2-phospho-L-lactate guanylyltransferase [Egibacter rhizosphaerae]
MDPHIPPVAAIVPLKALGDAKTRLRGALGPAARRELAVRLAARVLEACREAGPVERVLVVAGDEAVGEVARRHGADVVVEPRPGLTAALETADATVAAHAASIVVAGDLPWVTSADVEAVCVAGVIGRRVVVAPTEDGGTGALLREPPGVIGTAYGSGSAAAHRRLAAQAGVPLTVIERPGLALDVDTPDDLRRADGTDAAL